MSIIAIQPQLPHTILNTAAGIIEGDAFALPAIAALVEWQTVFTVDPDAIEVFIQTSLNGVDWNTVATTTDVEGASGNFITAAKFIRAVIDSITGGDEVTVIVNASPGYFAGGNGGDGNPAGDPGSVQFNDDGSFGGFGEWNSDDGAIINGTLPQYVRDWWEGFSGAFIMLGAPAASSGYGGLVLATLAGGYGYGLDIHIFNGSVDAPTATVDQDIGYFGAGAGFDGSSLRYLAEIAYRQHGEWPNVSGELALRAYGFGTANNAGFVHVLSNLVADAGVTLDALKAPSGQTYMLVIDDQGAVSSQAIS